MNKKLLASIVSGLYFVAPFISSAQSAASVTFTDTTTNKVSPATVNVGNNWLINVTGPVGSAVIVTGGKNGSSATNQVGNISSAGGFSMSGQFSASDVGTWSETWKVGDVTLPTFTFQVVAGSSGGPIVNEDSFPDGVIYVGLSSTYKHLVDIKPGTDGYTGPFSIKVVSGSVPSGYTFSAQTFQGSLSDGVVQPGTYNFTIKAVEQRTNVESAPKAIVFKIVRMQGGVYVVNTVDGSKFPVNPDKLMTPTELNQLIAILGSAYKGQRLYNFGPQGPYYVDYGTDPRRWYEVNINGVWYEAGVVMNIYNTFGPNSTSWKDIVGTSGGTGTGGTGTGGTGTGGTGTPGTGSIGTPPAYSIYVTPPTEFSQNVYIKNSTEVINSILTQLDGICLSLSKLPANSSGVTAPGSPDLAAGLCNGFIKSTVANIYQNNAGNLAGATEHRAGTGSTGATNPIPTNVKIVTVNALNVRTSANLVNNIVRQLKLGDQITVTGSVSGESVEGLNTWWTTSDGYYVWTGGTTR